MAGTTLVTLLAVGSVTLGISLLAGSAIVLQEIRQVSEGCETFEPSLFPAPSSDVCRPMEAFMAATSLGIIAGTLQIFVFFFAVSGEGKLSKVWFLSHIGVALVTTIAFVVGMVFDGREITKHLKKEHESRLLFFHVCACLDAVFSLILIILIWLLNVK